MKSVRSIDLSFKYYLFTTSGSSTIGEVYGVAHAQLFLQNTVQWCNYTITLQSPNYNE